MEPTPRADKVIEFSLRHVPFDGWTIEALKRGAHDAGVEATEAIKLFNNKPLNMIEYYSHMLDRQTKEIVKQKELENMKISDRIACCVMTRLKLMAPYREAAQKASVILCLPQNAPLATKLLYNTVDTMWYCAGDTATDFNYYPKRGLLGMVYTSTLLYWFRDMSVEYANTQKFLHRRIENVMLIPKMKAQARTTFESVTKPIRDFLFPH